MAADPDPYHTLGLPRGAPLGEVKKAYRRLAKANHPDAAGEAALPRFLAIQAAYDQIAGPGSGAPGGPGRPRRTAGARPPWEADPTRADATHRAYGGRARRTRASGSRPRPEPGPPPPPPPPRSGGARSSRPPNRATLGSTSYDGAEAEPFEPDWGGASWYGTTSGTYWTLNPKEYADPRKHGPEYQARARRAAATSRDTDPDSSVGASPPDGASDGASPPDAAPPDAAPSGTASSSSGAQEPTHTTSSWWEVTTGGGVDGSASPAAAPAEAAQTTDPPGAAPATGAAPVPEAGATTARPPGGAVPTAAATGTAANGGHGGGWAWLDDDRPRGLARVVRGVLGWVPLALGLGWLTGEVTGCARFSADCAPSTEGLVWLAQAAILGGLLLIPRLAAVCAYAALAAMAAAIPGALLMTALERSASDDVVATSTDGPSLALLGGLLVVAWVAGAAFGILRAMRRAPRPVS